MIAPFLRRERRQIFACIDPIDAFHADKPALRGAITDRRQDEDSSMIIRKLLGAAAVATFIAGSAIAQTATQPAAPAKPPVAPELAPAPACDDDEPPDPAPPTAPL